MFYNKNGNVIVSDLKLDFPVLSTDEVEKGYDGNWYLIGTAPKEPTIEEQVAKLEQDYQMTRWQREGILSEGSLYSDYTKAKAQEIEDLAAELRGNELSGATLE